METTLEPLRGSPISSEPLTGIYLGNRSLEFKRLISSLLKGANIKKKYITILTNPASMEVYSDAFTSELIDAENNYQVLEQIGDLSGNKFIVCYIYRRFPQLKCAEGVKVAARLRINYGAKQSFSKIAEDLGLWAYISATKDLRQRKKKSLLEDVFEAFLGATESLLDDNICYGVGYATVYKFLQSIFDKIDISLKYEHLYDPKTRLKELFDMCGEKLGSLVYEEQKISLSHSEATEWQPGGAGKLKINLLTHSRAFRIVGKNRIVIGEGTAALKIDAQQNAATDALKNLATEGFIKHPPGIYAKFAAGTVGTEKETKVEDILKICGSAEEINSQFFTRGKSKYQNKYTSTALIKYARIRDYKGIKQCLEMGADPNISDSEGLSALDIFLIGPIREKTVEKVVRKFLKVQPVLDLHNNVFETYLSRYSDAFREELNGKLNMKE